MDATSSNLVMLLFDEAAELDPPSRAEFLNQRCDDIAVRLEVESLLLAYEDAEGFLDDQRVGSSRLKRELEPHQSGTRIGNYELLDLLGEGGFARVFHAKQTHPVRRDVAIKIIKLGMDTRAVIARFELERQALAMMDHPGIAAVYDAGANDVGRPYFVMELVRGERITRFADNANLNVAARARLFVDVCNAVHHAHQKGILHRDLKPSNILVTTVDGQPQPKIIDFGIAKATQGNITDATFMTAEQQMIGTPRYMSPEQAISGGADVDTRSDIYSLGTVLYELMTGAPPAVNESSKSGPSGVLSDLRRLRDQAPPALPSTRADDARRRDLRGELDWIILKCLNHDRALRYESAAALAADLQAHLGHRPIIAAPPSAVYRIRKFVRRNALAVSAVALVLAALLVGAIVSTMQAVRATRAERLAQRHLQDAVAANESLTAVNRFLTNDMIGSADPQIAKDRDLTVREALDNAARAVGDQFADRPLVEAAVRQSVGAAYHGLGKFDVGLDHTAKSLEIRKRLLGEEHPDTILAANDYVSVLANLGRTAEAEPLARQAIETSERVQGPEHYETIRAYAALSHLLITQGRWKEAEAPALESWKRSQRTRGDRDAGTLTAVMLYANALSRLGRAAEAEPILREAIEHARSSLGENSPVTISLLNNHGMTLGTLGRDVEALPSYKLAWELSVRVRGEDHTETISGQNNYAMVLQRLGRPAEAEPLFRDALERRRRTLGEDHPQTLMSLNNYGSVLILVQRFADAEPYAKESLDRSARVLGRSHPSTIMSISNYARVHKEMNRLPEAVALLKEAFERSRALGADSPLAMQAANSYGGILLMVQRPAEAEPILRDSLERRRRTIGDVHPQTLRSLSDLAQAIEQQGRDEEALLLYRELYDKSPAAQMSRAQIVDFRTHYGVCLARLGRHVEAKPVLAESLQQIREIDKLNTARGRAVLEALASAFDKTGQTNAADQLRTEMQSLPPRPSPATRP